MGKEWKHTPEREKVASAALTTLGSQTIAGVVSGTATVVIYDVFANPPTQLASLRGIKPQGKEVTQIVLQRHYAVLNVSRSASIWNWQSGSQIHRNLLHDVDHLMNFDEGRVLVYMEASFAVHLWSLETGESDMIDQPSFPVSGISVFAGKILLICGMTIRIIKADSRQVVNLHAPPTACGPGFRVILPNFCICRGEEIGKYIVSSLSTTRPLPARQLEVTNGTVRMETYGDYVFAVARDRIEVWLCSADELKLKFTLPFPPGETSVGTLCGVPDNDLMSCSNFQNYFGSFLARAFIRQNTIREVSASLQLNMSVK